MKFHVIPKNVLQNVFQCEKGAVDAYVRLDCWGEGSCFFHSVCLLVVSGNQIENGKQITYTLDVPNPAFRTFQVPLLTPHLKSFPENFRQVGVMLRKKLSEELARTPSLWKQFLRTNPINLNRTDKAMQSVHETITELAQVDVWADIWTIRYCAWRLRLNILFVNPDSQHEPIYCGVENFTNGPKTLFIYWSNKTHFEPIVKCIANSNAQRTFGQDHHFIKCLAGQYKRGCPLDPIQ